MKKNVESQENPEQHTENTTLSVKAIFLSTLKERLPNFWGKAFFEALYLILYTIIQFGIGLTLWYVYMLGQVIKSIFLTIGYKAFEYYEKSPNWLKPILFLVSRLMGILGFVVSFLVLGFEVIGIFHRAQTTNLKKMLDEWNLALKEAMPEK